MPSPTRVEFLVGLEDGTGRFLAAFQRCDGVFLVEPRPIESCVVGTPVGWLEHSFAILEGYFDAQLVHGKLLMSGSGGFLYELEVKD